jgi:hypothetical protein
MIRAMNRRASRVAPTPMPIAAPVERPLLLDICTADCEDVAGFAGAFVVAAIVVCAFVVAAFVVCAFVGDNAVAEFGVFTLVVAGVGVAAGGVSVAAAWVGVSAAGVVAGSKSDM